MAFLEQKEHGPLSAIFWILGLVFIASVLVHVNYILLFGAGDWFRSQRSYYMIGWGVQLVGLFGPSLVLLFLWMRKKHRHWALFSSLLLALLAYQSWQPLLLNLLSAWDVYPTHLEAFHNFTYRKNWLVYD